MRRALFALAVVVSSLIAPFGSSASQARVRRTPPQYVPVATEGIEIYWGGTWWKGEILATAGDRFLVRYDGWSSIFDEWVGRSRLRPSPTAHSPRVDIQWGGSWYPGIVVHRSGSAFLVHYDGWSDAFDEWVGADRLRWRYVEVAVRPEPMRPGAHHRR